MSPAGQNEHVNPVWTTPHRTAPVDAVVALPGSKSITARALVLAALADGPEPARAAAARPRHRPDGRWPARARRRHREDGGRLAGHAPAAAGPGRRRRRAGRHRAAVPAPGRRPGRRPGPGGRRPAAARPAERRADLRTARRSACGSTTAAAAARRSPCTAPAGSAAARSTSTRASPRRSSPACCLPPRASTRASTCRSPAGVPSMPHVEMTVTTLRAHGVESGDRPRLAGPPGPDRRPRRRDRTRPLQRRPVPGRGAGHRRPGDRPRLARGHHPARRPARPAPARDGRRRSSRTPTDCRSPAAGTDPRRWSPTWARWAS